jgi:hypothetical protein
VSAEVAWYVGCPLVAAGLSVAAVRFTRSARTAVARPGDEEEAPLQLAGPAPTPPAERADAGGASIAPAAGTDDSITAAMREKRGVLARLMMRRGVETVVRHRALQPLAATRDVAGADHPEDAACSVAATGLTEFAVSARAPEQTIVPSSVEQFDLLGSERALGHGIVELDEPAGDEHPVGGPAWAADVAAREATLARSLQARADAERLARQREDEAAALRDQEDLERIAVAEQARVRAQARARRWFARLDADLDAPTAAERSTLATTLGIRAPWAGKLLREAFAQEEEPQVRARILGALVAGDHLDVPEPFETGFARGGIERAAVWEMLWPRRDDAQWIAEVLAPLVDAMQAA